MIKLLHPNSFLVLSAILLLAGCGGPGRDNSDSAITSMNSGEAGKETVAVSGKVTVGGEPAGSVTMAAYLEGGGRKPVAQCVTKKDGTYCWETYVECDGLPPGDYRFAFKKSTEPRPRPGASDAFRGKYKNPMQNDFSLKVESGNPQVDVNYDL